MSIFMSPPVIVKSVVPEQNVPKSIAASDSSRGKSPVRKGIQERFRTAGHPEYKSKKNLKETQNAPSSVYL